MGRQDIGEKTRMGRIDFPSTEEGFIDFKNYVKNYLKTGKMKLLIVSKRDAILRTRLATHYDSAFIRDMSEEQIKELITFVGNDIEVWFIEKFYWDEEVKERKVK